MGNLDKALAEIDMLNKADPNLENGTPKEVLYSIRMTQVLNTLNPKPSELLQIAARAQHICRWRIPREAFPDDRLGYHKWRKKCRFFHAKLAVQIMKKADYSSEECEQVATMLRKEGLGEDNDSQIIEDVACLVFFKFYVSDYLKKFPPEKAHQVVSKIWQKMSPKAQQMALTYTISSNIVSMIR